MNTAYRYDQVNLTPKFGTLPSRRGASTTCFLREKSYKSPVIPANMTCCINVELARWLSENGYFYSMHRFDGDTNKKDLYHFIETANKENWRTISVSVGVQDDDKKLVEWINHFQKRVDYLWIDLAHGYSLLMKEMLEYLKNEFEPTKKPIIIAGNVATSEAVISLAEWGADIIKVGIGGGKACTTKHHTGFHVPMFSCVQECTGWTMRVPQARPQTVNGKYIYIIADGGVSENGDFAKALAAGADMVMAGSIFAACKDSPAESVYENRYLINRPLGEIIIKKYYGSASYHNGNQKNIEGTLVELPCNGMTYSEKLQEIGDDLKSSISYSGGSAVGDLKGTPYTVSENN